MQCKIRLVNSNQLIQFNFVRVNTAMPYLFICRMPMFLKKCTCLLHHVPVLCITEPATKLSFVSILHCCHVPTAVQSTIDDLNWINALSAKLLQQRFSHSEKITSIFPVVCVMCAFLLEFYILATSKVISKWVPICGCAHLW